MPRLETEELLKDARLVVEYAVRVGKLPDENLPKAVKNLEASPTGGTAGEIALLITALNNGVQAIAPMTLVELRAGQSPFDPRNQRVTRRLQMFFCVVTILLTVMVARFTEYLHREETALKALQEIQDTHPLDKLNALRRMVRFEKVLDEQTSINYDQYHRSVRELRELQDKLSGGYELLRAVAEGAPFSSLSFSWGLTKDSYSAGTASAADKPSSGSATPIGNPKSDATAGGQRSTGLDICDPKDAEKTQVVLKDYPIWLKSVIEDSVDEFCFLTKLQLGVDSFSQPTSALSYQIQTSMAALSGWVLPFLYGLLGASVFVMRDLLNPRTPTLGFFPTLLRVALGGIAGIIIGWFWIPTASKTADVASITSVPFGLAFLTGFSIDVLFSLLDRLNKTISDPPATMPKVATTTT
jgi:spore maturation protein SpmA